MALTKDEYLKASTALATGFGPTTDFHDPQIGATVQSEGGVPTAASELPGQVYSVDQLPNPAAAVAYGLPPQVVPAHLILDDADNATKHVQAKDALDVVTGELRKELGDPAIAFDGTVRTQDDALLSLSERTGAGLAEGKAEAGEPFVDGVKGGDGETTTGGGGIVGPIDSEGVQQADGEVVSEEAGTQGELNTESGDPGDTASPESSAPKSRRSTSNS